MRRAAVRTALAVACALSSIGTASAGDKLSPASVQELERWIAAVNEHVPGKGDQWASAMAHLSYKRREDLNPAMSLFLAFLNQAKVVTKTPEEMKTVDLARRTSQNPGLAVFIKRAAILHSDAAILTERIGGIDDRTAPPPPRWSSFSVETSRGVYLSVPGREVVPPLLTNNRFVASRDGEVIGQTPADWNWPFARSLLDLLVPASSYAAGGGACRGAECLGSIVRTGPQTLDPFVPAWYHAIAAYMLGNGLYAEATAHLDRGVAALPNDSWILFDRGCYSEVFGLPMQQVLRDDNKSRMYANIPDESATNADAESWYRRALAANPAFVEARVRLGRLLDVKEDHQGALDEINKALSENPKGFVAFYAHLFAGRAAQALGHLDDARSHFAQAAAWFPDAQSAALGQSQAALNAADVPAALEPLRVLTRQPGLIAADPWWYYHLGAGRDLDDLLAALWASVPKRE